MMKYIRKEEWFQINNINSYLTKYKRETERLYITKDRWKEMIKVRNRKNKCEFRRKKQ